MDSRKTGDLDPVLVVDHGSFTEVEFIRDDFATGVRQGAGAGKNIPFPGGADVIDMGLGTQFRT